MAPILPRYQATERLIRRAVPEWDGCVVIDPKCGTTHELNVTAWLLLELATSLTLQEIIAKYESVVGTKRLRHDHDVRDGLSELLSAGLLQRVCQSPVQIGNDTNEPEP